MLFDIIARKAVYILFRNMTPYEMLRDSYLVDIPDMPTCEGPMGIFYDFNDGARIFLPEGNWHISIEDSETGNILNESDSKGGLVQSTFRFYVKFLIKVWNKDSKNLVFEHKLNLKDKETQILFPLPAFGDTIAWMPAAIAFTEKHGCKTEFIMGNKFSCLFAKQYKNIIFSDPSIKKPFFSKPYASYHLGILTFKNEDYSRMYSPFDTRISCLCDAAGGILGINDCTHIPKIDYSSKRKIKGRYVVIATKTSYKAKFWNNEKGWIQIIAYLRKIGYRVLCIDKDAVQDSVGIPAGAENFTGDIPLTERADLIKHCDFFIGLDTGLSWLAWCIRRPVIVIGGFTLPFHIFKTPYYVFSPYACHGCYNDERIPMYKFNYYSCPRHKGTNREYECTRLITGKQVIRTILRLMSDNNLTRPCDGRPVCSKKNSIKTFFLGKIRNLLK